MWSVGLILQLNSVKKQVITRLSGYVIKSLLSADSECIEMMGLIGMGNNPMVGATVACAVAAPEAEYHVNSSDDNI